MGLCAPTGDGRVTIGVTDERCSGVDRDAVAVSERDVGALTGAIGRSLATPLEARDVIGSFAGLRPLVAGETGSTADLSRRHAVIEDPDSGALTLLGGKLTTYRAMAQDVVDRIAERPGVTAGGCRTASLPLVGAAAPERVALHQRAFAPDPPLRERSTLRRRARLS